MELDDLPAAQLHALHGSDVLHLECSSSTGDELLGELPEALPELRSTHSTLAETYASDVMLSAAAGCERLEELRVEVAGPSELCLDSEALGQLASGRCKKLRSVVLVGTEASLSGLMLLAASSREALPELRCVDVSAHLLQREDCRLACLERLERKQQQMQEEAVERKGMWQTPKKVVGRHASGCV